MLDRHGLGQEDDAPVARQPRGEASRRLIVAPDEFDGTAAENSKIDMSTSTELHNGPTYYHSTAGLYMMVTHPQPLTP